MLVADDGMTSATNSKLPELPKPGDLVGGRFRITELIGSGGFGTVYRALQENVGREVALKFLAPSVAKDPVNIERFRREALHVSQLRHPNTITLYDYGQTDEGLFYMVMELLEGISLADEVQRHGAIDQGRAAHIFLQVLKSLSEAHQRGLVHRDLKPENIHLCEMFGEQDYVKVLDFGVAKMTMFEGGDDMEEKLTRAGRIFGTPMYMAPEQACAEPITPATDIYALGLLLFEILTGLPPVTGRNRMDVIHKQIREEVPKLTRELKGTPLGDVIRRATLKKPEERYHDASQMWEAFYEAIRAMRIIPGPKGSTRPEISAFELGVDPRLVNTPSPSPSFEAVPARVLEPTPAQPKAAPIKASAPPPLPKGATKAPVAKAQVAEDTSSVLTSSPPVSTLLERKPAKLVKTQIELKPAAKVQAPVAPVGVEPATPSEEPTQIAALPVEQDAEITEAHVEPEALPSLPVYQELSLIGRDKDIMSLLDLVIQSLQARSGHMVLVEGEGGVGKTRVMGSLREELHHRQVGMCVGFFRRNGQPLEALRDALADYWWVAQADRATADSVIRADLSALSFPAHEIDFLIDFIRPVNQLWHNPQEASHLFARLERALLLLAELRPLVLTLEDIQYADSATLSFLEYFAVTLRAQPASIVLMLTLRSGERTINPDLEQSLRTMSANVGVGLSRIRLKRLRGRELSVLLDAVLPLDARLKERIAWLSQGNPQHAIQIIHYLWAESNLKADNGRWKLARGTAREIDLPPDLMDLMILRVRQCIETHTAQVKLERTVTWLAILGIRVPVELLAKVCFHAEGLERHQLEGNLAVLADYGIVHQRLHRDVMCVEFDNSLLREALLRDVLRSTEARSMHKLAAEYKHAFYSEHDIELPMLELAEHWRQAGMDKPYRESLFEAARRSMVRHDPRGAREQFRELLRLLESHNIKDAMWGESMLSLAELSRRFGELGLAEDNYVAVLQTETLAGAPRASADRGLAHLLFALGRYPEAVRHYREALSHSTNANDRAGVAKALIGLSRVHLRQGDPGAGQKVRSKLKAMLSELPVGELRGKVLLHLAEAAQRLGQIKERHEFLTLSLEQFKQGHDRQGYSDALVDLGSLLILPGENSPDRLEEAGKLLREALEIKRAIGDRQGVADVFKFLGFVEQERGDLEAAEHYYHQALRMHEALGALFHIGTVHNSLGLATMLMGQYETSQKHFERGVELFERVGDPLAASHAMLNKGTLLLNRLVPEQAMELLLQTRELKESLGSAWGLYELYNHLALAHLWLGQIDQAEQLLRHTLKELGQSSLVEDRAVASSILGILYCVQGKLQVAALELGRARSDAEGIGSPRLTAFCQANAAFYAALTGDEETLVHLYTSFKEAPHLGALRIDAWMELIEGAALERAQEHKDHQTVRLLRTVHRFWEIFSELERARALDEKILPIERALA